MKTEVLIEKIKTGVKKSAYARTKNIQFREELIQEGMLAVLLHISGYPNKTDEELVRIAGRISINKMNTLIRIEKNWSNGIPHSTKLDIRPIDNWKLDVVSDVEEISSSDVGYDKVEEKEFVLTLRKSLSSMGKKILNEMINPGKETLMSFAQDKIDKTNRKSQGHLVMDLESDTITNTHIATGLGISKATISREIAKIRDIASALLKLNEEET